MTDNTYFTSLRIQRFKEPNTSNIYITYYLSKK